MNRLMYQPKVVIFLATYNGQRFLDEQLDSIASQTHKNIELWASDDGSDDNTYSILKRHQARLPPGRFIIQHGPRKGFAANFLSLICSKKANGDYYAYCDQDDVWEPDKLQKGINWLNTIPCERLALYCSRTKLVDEHNNEIGYSECFKKPPGFLNALVQNIGSGNTMLFNHAAINCLREAGDNINVVAHDWWTYLLITGAGGDVFYDPSPSMRYRQHKDNVIGSNSGWRARLLNIHALFKGRFRVSLNLNLQALQSIEHLLSEKNKFIFKQFDAARKSPSIFAMIKIKRLGIYRQTFLGSTALIAGTLFKKI